MKQNHQNQLIHVANSVIALEVQLNILLSTLMKLNPELEDEYIKNLQHFLTNQVMPTSGSKQILETLLIALQTSLPTHDTEH